MLGWDSHAWSRKCWQKWLHDFAIFLHHNLKETLVCQDAVLYAPATACAASAHAHGTARQPSDNRS